MPLNQMISPISSVRESNDKASATDTTTPPIDGTNRSTSTTSNRNVKGAREVYEESKNSIQVLLAVAIGYKDDDNNQLVDFETEPFVSAPRSRQSKPATKHLTPELGRRWERRNRDGKKPGTQWRMEKIISWLHDNPPNEDEDDEK